MIAPAVGQRMRPARCWPPGTQLLPARARSSELIVMLNELTKHERYLICAYPIPLIHTIRSAPCTPICARISNDQLTYKPYFIRVVRLHRLPLAPRVPRFLRFQIANASPIVRGSWDAGYQKLRREHWPKVFGNLDMVCKVTPTRGHLIDITIRFSLVIYSDRPTVPCVSRRPCETGRAVTGPPWRTRKAR